MFDKTTKKLTHYLCQKDENKFAGLFANDGVTMIIFMEHLSVNRILKK